MKVAPLSQQNLLSIHFINQFLSFPRLPISATSGDQIDAFRRKRCCFDRSAGESVQLQTHRAVTVTQLSDSDSVRLGERCRVVQSSS